MIRALAVFAVAAVVLCTAAAAATITWRTVATGKALQVGAAPTGYLSLTRAQEKRWIGRTVGTNRTAAQNAVTAQRAVVALFLDGLPCARDIEVTSLTRTGSTLTAHVLFTRPPVGMAMCVRNSTLYSVLGVPRAALGKTPPTHVAVAASARS